MARTILVLAFLLFNLTGNLSVVRDQLSYQGEPCTQAKVKWPSRFERLWILDSHYDTVRLGLGSEGKFVTRHLLEANNNKSSNRSTPPHIASLSRGERISFTLGYSFILLFGLFGNFLILFVIATNKEFHNNLNSLLCNLVVADVLRMLISIPFELFVINKIGETMSHIPARAGPSGSIFCKSVFSLPLIFTFAFVFTLTFMTIERFVAIVSPFKASMFKNKSKWIILGVWLASFALGSPALYAHTSVMLPNGDYICERDYSVQCKGNIVKDFKCNLETDKKYLTACVYITFVVAFLFILILHVIMIVVLNKHRSQFDHESSSVSRSPTHYTRDVIRMIGTVSVVYVATSLPSQIYQFGSIYDKAWVNKAMPVYFNFLLLFIENSHSMIYPWVYPLFVKRFRAKYANLFREHILRKKPRSSSDASSRYERATVVTQSSVTNKLIQKNSNESKL